MTPLLMATTNAGKLREIREILRGLAIPLRSLNDFPPVPEPDETGSSFSANALLKAHAYAQATGMVTVAEDSGLVVDALGGAPGIHSARYPGVTYPEKFANLYRSLASYPQPWTARYVCAVAVVDGTDDRDGRDGSVLFETIATVEGEISPEPRGAHGFGYDPIFYYPPYKLTFGEVDDARKLAVAHRGVAFTMLRRWLEGGEYLNATR
ncbi:MAG TPA: non-canonical purine NTP pyrophosphatase [Vicinamibacterales bacterium]|nr:non-canonical purine NTP pyrophosphatase [Vicinamibacterales bacterium]